MLEKIKEIIAFALLDVAGKKKPGVDSWLVAAIEMINVNFSALIIIIHFLRCC